MPLWVADGCLERMTWEARTRKIVAVRASYCVFWGFYNLR